MRLVKFQRSCFWKILQLWLLFVVYIQGIVAEEDKTFNLKIGFDLTPGSQGASALRIRHFEDGNQFRHRALRAVSDSSSSNENERKKEDNIEMKAAEDSSVSAESEEYDGTGRQKSTKGLRADEYEPDVGPADQEAFDKGSDSDTRK